MDELQPKETDTSFKQKVYIALIVFIFGICSYLGYDYYQFRQYVERVIPIHNSFNVIGEDVLNMGKKSEGKRFYDLFDEVKSLKQASKDLKMKLAEPIPKNAKSHLIKEKFNGLLDLQSDLLDNYNVIFQNEMAYQSSNEYVKEFTGLPYSESTVNKARNEMDEAKKKLDKAYKSHESLLSRYKYKKSELNQLIPK